MPKTMLLADDSITIQKVIQITFASTDIQIISVDNGDAALQKISQVQPHIVLADVVMPGKNGYEVCQAIKSNPATKNIPVLLLAGTFEPFDAERAKVVGADDHIVKPFESQALVEKVKRLLEGGTVGSMDSMPTATPSPFPKVPSAIPAAASPSPFAAAPSPVFTKPLSMPPTGTKPFIETPAPVASKPSPFSGLVKTPSPITQSKVPLTTIAIPETPRSSTATSASWEKSLEDIPVLPLDEDDSGLTEIEIAELEPSHVVSPITIAPKPQSQTKIEAPTSPTPPVATLDASARAELSAMMREIVEKVVWEVVPELAETIIREELERLLREK